MGDSAVTSGEASSTAVSHLDESDIELTPAEVLSELQQAWMNEQFSPELLPHKFDIVDCITDQLHAMEENLARSSTKNSLRNCIHKMEIEKFVFFCLEDDTKRKEQSLDPKMSKEERKFAAEFRGMLTTHLEDSVLKKMPANVQTLDYNKIAPRPNLDEYVFLKVNRDMDNPTYDVGDVDGQSWEKDGQHLLPYKYVKQGVEGGDVSLI